MNWSFAIENSGTNESVAVFLIVKSKSRVVIDCSSLS